jgi:hypothetical protein
MMNTEREPPKKRKMEKMGVFVILKKCSNSVASAVCDETPLPNPFFSSCIEKTTRLKLIHSVALKVKKNTSLPPRGVYCAS